MVCEWMGERCCRCVFGFFFFERMRSKQLVAANTSQPAAMAILLSKGKVKHSTAHERWHNLKKNTWDDFVYFSFTHFCLAQSLSLSPHRFNVRRSSWTVAQKHSKLLLLEILSLQSFESKYIYKISSVCFNGWSDFSMHLWTFNALLRYCLFNLLCDILIDSFIRILLWDACGIDRISYILCLFWC